MHAERQPIDSRHIVLCFQVHQPKRLTDSLSSDHTGITPESDQEIFQRIAKECYLPANFLLQKLIGQYPNIKISFAISGLALEQMELYSPETLSSFKKLAETGSVDFIAEPYHHSLSFLLDSDEFEIQILQHVEKIVGYFGIRPSVFKNTNLFYNDDIGRRIHMMGFEGILTEGCERALRHHKPNKLYEHRDSNGLKILMRNQSLSDDIAFRVGKKYFDVTAEKFVSWLDMMPEDENLVTLCIDYETFGEHNKADSGVFEFLEHLLLMLAIQNNYRMMTGSEIVHRYHAYRQLSIPDLIAIAGNDVAYWIGNDRQREALSAVIALENIVKRKADPDTLKLWRELQASDHFYYMSDRAQGPGSLSPYKSPEQAFDTYMQKIDFIHQNLKDPSPTEDVGKHNEVLEAERRNIDAPVWALNLGSHPTSSS